MFRPTARPLALASVLVSLVSPAGCSGPAEARATPRPAFDTENQKMLACLDLQDHIVDIYAAAYVEKQGVTLTSNQQTAFRDGWAQELARRGTFERFEESCFGTLTPIKYGCGMSSRTTGGLSACMKLSSR